MNAYDYIVIGGGSSGCITASQLAAEGKASVLLLEAGEPAENNPETLSHDGFKYAFANDRVMWDRMSSVQENCGNRPVYTGTGTGMGGSGSVNGMVYTRGDRRDFDQWPEGWKWEDIVPYFESLEERLSVQSRPGSKFTELFIAAAGKVGFRKKEGLNDGDLSGFMGYNKMNFRDDSRRSSYVAFIKDGKPASLTVETEAKVQRIRFEGKKAVAVEYRKNGQLHTAEVQQEVVCCAGALETPKLLMVSGVGPKQELDRHGIPVIHEAAGIGQNLHDHPNVCMFYKGKRKMDFGYPQLYGFDRVNDDLDLPAGQPDTCFVAFAAPVTLQQSMYRMLPVLALPGKLYHNNFLRNGLRKLVDVLFAMPFVNGFVDKIYGIVVILGKPVSKGTLTLASSNPDDQAVIDVAYYQDPRDVQTMLKGIEKARQIAAQSELVEWGNTPLVAANKSDNKVKVWKWVEGATMTTFHFCGTCAMGSDNSSPVDTQLKLKGIDNVRIADASVIPEVPVSAINAPSMMIGYRAAEFILGEKSIGDSQATNQNQEAATAEA